MKKNHYLTLPRSKRKLDPTLIGLYPMSRKKRLRNRHIQMTLIKESLGPYDIYSCLYNRAISMILGCQLKVQVSDILNIHGIFYKYNLAKNKNN